MPMPKGYSFNRPPLSFEAYMVKNEPRFWSRVQNGEAGACWEWTGKRHGFGYGKLRWTSVRGPARGAHCVSWEIANGRQVPPGMLVLHSCDNPPCVNPAHLRLGTYADNMRDSLVRGRHPKKNRTHCKHGHLYDVENTHMTKDGRRRCRACDRAKSKRQTARRAAQRIDGVPQYATRADALADAIVARLRELAAVPVVDRTPAPQHASLSIMNVRGTLDAAFKANPSLRLPTSAEERSIRRANGRASS